jgi:hypothetical protein
MTKKNEMLKRACPEPDSGFSMTEYISGRYTTILKRVQYRLLALPHPMRGEGN